MLAIQRRSHRDCCTPNILPCRIHHTGPTKVTKRYWTPRIESDGTVTSHFRGRRLRGRQVRLPKEYEGLILKTTEKSLAQPMINYSRLEDNSEIEDDEVQECLEPTKVIEQLSSFDEILVWGHDQVPTADDTFVKGIEEWIAFAEAINGKSDSTCLKEDN